jgi:ubiquinone/menaquinone biosynthesis C-methylase UbiE
LAYHLAMQRTPEPELMVDKEQVAAYANTDWSELHDPMVRRFQKEFGTMQGTLLDVGCGSADVTIRFLRACEVLNALAIDASDTMLELAKRDAIAAGVQARIEFRQSYLPDDTLPSAAFDAVISNSVLHHMNDPLDLWRTLRRCAKPGAPLMVMDLYRPPDIDAARALVQKHAPDAPPVLVRDFFNSLCAAYSEDEVRGQLRETGLDALHVEKTDELHLLVWGFN